MTDVKNEAPLIQLNDAIVRRDGKNILEVDSFVLRSGENIALLGPNGAGKSTFIRLITREDFPLYRDNPPVLFRGNDRTTLQETKKVLGVVSSTMQDQITVHLPAKDIVAGGLFGTLGVPQMYRVTPESQQRVMEILEMLGVADLAERDIKTLSTGQARRILWLARSSMIRKFLFSMSRQPVLIQKACTMCESRCAIWSSEESRSS